MSSSSSINDSAAIKCEYSSRVSLSYLPNDLLLNCLARVSRLYYPTLSLVSKRFRSFLVSKDLYKTRKLLGCTESCLYVCLRFPGETNSNWYTLCRRATRFPNPNKSSDNVLVSIPTRNSSPMFSCDHISVGSNIYQFGGLLDCVPCPSRVFFMDCRFHTWHEAPSMQIDLEYPLFSVLDGKIYVTRGIEDCDSSNWVECFNPKTQIWEHVSFPDANIRGTFILESLAIKGNLYLCGDKNVVYKPKEERWDAVGFEIFLDCRPNRFCVIDNVLYRYESNILEWYDSKGRAWRILMGLKELPIIILEKLYNSVRLVDHGGKMAVLWEESVCGKCEIWCAEVTLERHNEQEIHGKIEWCDVVLTNPKTESSYLHFFAVTV